VLFSNIVKYLLLGGIPLYDINYISKNSMNGRSDRIDLIYMNRKVLEEAS